LAALTVVETLDALEDRLSHRLALPAHRAHLSPGQPTGRALLLKEHLRLTYRGNADLLALTDRQRRRFARRIMPDYPTPWWFGRRHLLPGVPAAALAETVAPGAGRQATRAAAGRPRLHGAWAGARVAEPLGRRAPAGRDPVPVPDRTRQQTNGG
jgi:hypothetical protein